jgi:hypothetical protein
VSYGCIEETPVPPDESTPPPGPRDDRERAGAPPTGPATPAPPADAHPPDGERPAEGSPEAPPEAPATSGRDDEIERWQEAGEDEEAGLPPPVDDGPLRTLPIRHLPLARDPRRPSVPPPPARTENAGRGPTPRAWQWVPIGALIAMGTTMLLSAAVAAALPEAEQAVRAIGDSVAGIEDDTARMEAIEAAVSGPQGDAIRRTLIGMVAAFVAGLVLAGAVVGFLGRAGPLEAGLGTGAFALLSLLFMGGGLSLYTLPTPALAVGLGWIGGWIGARLRRWRESRRRPPSAA